MKLHKDSGDPLEPCPHMESMLNQTADGTASKLVEIYARAHAARCPRCGTFLARLTAMLGKLRRMSTEPAEPEKLDEKQWESLEARFAEVEG